MSDASLRTEFDAMAARAGLAIAPDRDAVMFDAFKALRTLLAHVHKPYAYADEPAFVSPGKLA